MIDSKLSLLLQTILDLNEPSLGTIYLLPNCTVVIYKAPFENKVCQLLDLVENSPSLLGRSCGLHSIQAQVFCTLFRFGARFDGRPHAAHRRRKLKRNHQSQLLWQLLIAHYRSIPISTSIVHTMGCTSSTPASGESIPLSAMGSRKGIGHTERMGSRAKDRKGIGSTERMGRAVKGSVKGSAPQAGALPPGPEIDLTCDGQGECAPELDDAGVMTEREVARRTSCSARSKTVELNTADKDSKIKVRYAFWTQRGYYPDGKSEGRLWCSCLSFFFFYSLPVSFQHIMCR